MKTLKVFLLSIICLPLLTSCWDRNLLKDVKLVMSAGFDLTPDGKILSTITIPDIQSGVGGTQVTGSLVKSAKSDTPRDTRNILNAKISEQFNASKLMVLLLGEEYARQDIYPGLDVFYREPKSSRIANIVVVKGRANDLLNLNNQEKKSMSEYLSDLLQSAKASTVIPKQSRPLISDIFDPGADFVLPLIESKENEVQVKGLAMFNEKKYTGYDLTLQESTLYLLMSNQKSKEASLKLKIHEGKEPKMKNFILFDVIKSKPNVIVKVKKPDDISVELSLDLKVEVKEYSDERLDSKKKINDLNRQLSELLTKKANTILNKMQEAKSDSLAIGRYIIAYHHDVWEKINWEEEYPNIVMNASVNAEITKHGVFF